MASIMCKSMLSVPNRAICEYEFQQYDDKDKIYKFCSPKVVRLLEVLKQFKPPQAEVDDSATPSASENSSQRVNGVKASEGSSEVEKCSSNVQELVSPASTPSIIDTSKPQQESKEEQPQIVVNPKPIVKGQN